VVQVERVVEFAELPKPLSVVQMNSPVMRLPVASMRGSMSEKPTDGT